MVCETSIFLRAGITVFAAALLVEFSSQVSAVNIPYINSNNNKVIIVI